MVKLQVTERMRKLLPTCEYMKIHTEIDYKLLKEAAKASQIPISTLILGSQFQFPQPQTVLDTTPEPAFIQAIKQKRLIRDYAKMTENVAGTIGKSENSEIMKNASFSVTMLSLVFLAFLAGYFGGELLGFKEYMVRIT